MNLDKQQLKYLRKLCKSHKVKHIYLFGSAVRDDFNEHSDYDFLVQFQEMDVMDYLDNYLEFKDELEKLTQRNVDLVEEQALKNPYLIRSIDRNKELLYG